MWASEYGPMEFRHGSGLPVDPALLEEELSRGLPITTGPTLKRYTTTAELADAPTVEPKR